MGLHCSCLALRSSSSCKGAPRRRLATQVPSAAGWLELANRHGFAFLLPQQQRANNPNLFFNWFKFGDVFRGHGEASSIKAMVDSSPEHYSLDASRVVVTGCRRVKSWVWRYLPTALR